MTTTAWAQPKVEIAFTTDPLAVTPTWTDVTRYARSVSITRGKSHELGQQQPGVCTVLLDNRDRRFDPTNTSSPYYPNVLPMKKIRISAVYNAVTYYLFTGYVESWPMKWADAVNDDVEVVAVDGLKVLNLRKIAGHTLRDAVLANSPTSYWILGEQSGASVAVDSGSGANNGTYQGTTTDFPDLGVQGPNPADVDTAVDFKVKAGWVSIPSAATYSGTGNVTLEAWIYVSDAVTGLSTIYQQGSVAVSPVLGLYAGVPTAGFPISVSIDDNAGNSATIVAPTTSPLTVNAWNHIVFSKSGTVGSGNTFLYLNGTVIASPVLGSVGTGNPTITQQSAAIAGTPGAASLTGKVGHVAIYNGVALTAGQVLAHYNATAGFAQPALSGTRIGVVLDEVSWPAADRVLDTGQFSMQAISQPLFTTAALSYLQSVISSEGYPADLFIDTQGRVVFQDRAHAIPASSATFGDGVGEYPYELDGTTAPVLDDVNIYNEVVAQAVNGTAQVSTDATSEAAYVTRSLPLTGLQNASDTDVAAVADVLRSRYKTPSTRLAALAIQPSDDATNLFPQVLGRELNDRILVKRTFYTGGGSVMSLDMRIEGITHQITPFGWRTVWQLAPTNPTNLLILDDATYGILDTDVLA